MRYITQNIQNIPLTELHNKCLGSSAYVDLLTMELVLLEVEQSDGYI